MLCVVMLVSIGLSGCGDSQNVSDYRRKVQLLREQLLTESLQAELGSKPAGEIGHVVFLSVCDTKTRAQVYRGSGKTLEAAWNAADEQARSGLKKSGLIPVWVKADVVYITETVSQQTFNEALDEARGGFMRYGIAFDDQYETALLEAQLNGCGIYDYENACVDLEKLNAYLRSCGKRQLQLLPESYTVFQTFSRFCDESDTVSKIGASGHSYGRRIVETVDAAYAEQLIGTASEYLVSQIKENGSFTYGWDPVNNEQLDCYNILRHAGTVWSLVCCWRMTKNEQLAQVIDRAVEYLLDQVVSRDEDTAYVLEKTTNEIKLGGCGLAVIALTEYMDAFGTQQYLEICRKLGRGILSLLDQTDGTYYHVLNADFTEKDEMRTVYYDGEATFALCRLYGLTGEEQWLDAAQSAVEHFIETDYVQYRDQWVAYSLNDITRYVEDTRYYAFALRNVQENLEDINLPTTSPVCFELLMATFELYDRLMEMGAAINGFDEDAFHQTIAERANRMLNGYFYPELAMYMAEPAMVQGAFMVREDGFRTRIDDVQHCIGGYYLYWKNYDKLVQYAAAHTAG